MKKVTKVTAQRITKSTKNISKALSPLDFLHECVSYLKYADEQKTERGKIEAEKIKAITSIEAQKEVILAYFNLRFKERKESVDRLFGVLDKGIKSKDNMIIDKALTGIVTIIKDSPLNDFECFSKQYLNGDIIEI